MSVENLVSSTSFNVPDFILDKLARTFGRKYSPDFIVQSLAGVRIQDFDKLLKNSTEISSSRQKDPNLELLSPDWLKHKFDLISELRRFIEGYFQRLEQGQSQEQSLESCCLELKGNILGERNEFFLGETIIPVPLAFKEVNGIRQIVGMGDCLIEDLYDQETREGVPLETWLEWAKPTIFSMTPGSILIIDSPSGKNMQDSLHKNSRVFPESQTLMIKKKIDDKGKEYIQGITVVNDLDLPEHENFLRRLGTVHNYLGGELDYDRILNVTRSIGILYAGEKDFNFSDVLNFMRSIKRTPWLRSKPKLEPNGKLILDRTISFEEGMADLGRVNSYLIMDQISEQLLINYQEELKLRVPFLVQELRSKGVKNSTDVSLAAIEDLLKNSDLAYETISDLKEMLLKMSKIAREGGGEELLNRSLSDQERNLEEEDIQSKVGCIGVQEVMSEESKNALKKVPLELRKYFCVRCGNCKKIINQVVLLGQICPAEPSCGAIRECL